MGKEELLEAKVMQKISLGHELNAAEKTLAEKRELEINERIEKSTKAVEEQLVARKKKAIEIVEIMEQNAAKSKKPLTAVEKKQIIEQIEANSVREGKERHENLLEEMAMSRKQFGHRLNAAEEKLVDKYVVKFEDQIALNEIASAFGM